jgi:hypothetical protein
MDGSEFAIFRELGKLIAELNLSVRYSVESIDVKIQKTCRTGRDRISLEIAGHADASDASFHTLSFSQKILH